MDLLTWAKRRLLAPTNWIGRAVLKRLLRQQIYGEGAERQDPVPPSSSQKLRPGSSRTLESRRGKSLTHRYKRGVSRIVINYGKIVESDQHSFEIMLTKHPTCPSPPTPTGDLSPPLVLALEQHSTTGLTRTAA